MPLKELFNCITKYNPNIKGVPFSETRQNLEISHAYQMICKSHSSLSLWMFTNYLDTVKLEESSYLLFLFFSFSLIEPHSIFYPSPFFPWNLSKWASCLSQIEKLPQNFFILKNLLQYNYLKTRMAIPFSFLSTHVFIHAYYMMIFRLYFTPPCI